MARNSKKCEKEEAANKKMVLKAMQKGNPEMAKIYANNAIRKNNEAVNYLRMSARFDAAASQIGTAVTTGMVSKTMSTVVNGLEKAVACDSMEKMSLMMDQFESQCGMLDVQNSYIDSAMSGSSKMTTPAEQVDELIQQVADAHGLEVNKAFQSVGKLDERERIEETTPEEQDELTQRLNSLRGGI